MGKTNIEQTRKNQAKMKANPGTKAKSLSAKATAFQKYEQRQKENLFETGLKLKSKYERERHKQIFFLNFQKCRIIPVLGAPSLTFSTFYLQIIYGGKPKIDVDLATYMSDTHCIKYAMLSNPFNSQNISKSDTQVKDKIFCHLIIYTGCLIIHQLQRQG